MYYLCNFLFLEATRKTIIYDISTKLIYQHKFIILKLST